MGTAFGSKNDYRLLPDNGNLSQRWSASPSLWRHDRFPSTDQEGWRTTNVWTIGDQFLYQLNNDADGMMFRGRAMMALLIVVLGALIYFWSRSLFGATGATISVVLFEWHEVLGFFMRVLKRDGELNFNPEGDGFCPFFEKNEDLIPSA